ncbi:MAG: ATPase, partial [Betaproteobacteria bacterium]|nr:ATPase [Betaproteobacteria bacterium]
GQPEFRGILQSPDMQQLRQRVVASYHLGPLDADETRGYIEHRLRTVGWQGMPGFDDDAFAALHRFTGGIPRRLNTTCDRLLLFGFLEEKTHFGEAEVNEVIDDLKNEVAHQDFHGATGVNNHASAGSVLHNEDTVRLAQRIDQVERSVNRILPIVRKILYTVSERNAATGEESGSPDSGAPH